MPPTRSQLEAAFALFDTDGSGTLSADELKAILTRPIGGRPPSFSSEQVDSIIKRFDTNGDGVLSLNEFVKTYAAVEVKASLDELMALADTPEDVAANWVLIVEQWAAEAQVYDTAPPSPCRTEAMLAAAATICLAAAEEAPCAHCRNPFAEKWGNAPGHCFDCKKPLSPSRAQPENEAMAAAEAVDAPYVLEEGGGLSADGQARHAARGVRVGFLLVLLASLPAAERRTVTTGQLVARLIKPATRRRRCRFVELPGMRGNIGTPRAFVSHVWSAPFADLVAAVAHAISEDECVWVGQHAEKVAAGP